MGKNNDECNILLQRCKSNKVLIEFHQYFKINCLSLIFVIGKFWKLRSVLVKLITRSNIIVGLKRILLKDWSITFGQVSRFSKSLYRMNQSIWRKLNFLRRSKGVKSLISKSDLLIWKVNNKYKYCHQDGNFFTVNIDKKNVDKGICKHLVASCIKTTTNLPGLVFMPKLLVTRWRHKNKPVYLSSPV